MHGLCHRRLLQDDVLAGRLGSGIQAARFGASVIVIQSSAPRVGCAAGFPASPARFARRQPIGAVLDGIVGTVGAFVAALVRVRCAVSSRCQTGITLVDTRDGSKVPMWEVLCFRWQVAFRPKTLLSESRPCGRVSFPGPHASRVKQVRPGLGFGADAPRSS